MPLAEPTTKQSSVVIGLDAQKNYISKFLIQEVTVPKEKTKQVRVSGARVLTSDKCMKIVQERKKKKLYNCRKERNREMQKSERNFLK